MTRLIDAKELKSGLKQYFSDGTLDSVSAKLAFNMILRKIDNAPTVNLEKTSFMQGYNYGCDDGKRFYERPQGEWHDDENGYFQVYCSVCKETNKYTTNFCPNCGADMRGDENDNN